jgi:hypothetical protein
MPTIHHLLKQLSPDSNTKGKQFEKITQWFLQNEPEWKVMRDYDLKCVISFHGRVQRAQDFASQYLKVLN